MSIIKANQMQLGIDSDPTKNFHFRSSIPGTYNLSAGNVGAPTADIVNFTATSIELLNPKSVSNPLFASNDKSLVTSEWCNNKLGSLKSTGILTTNTTLTIADIGKLYSLEATNLVITLPLSSTVPIGATFYIRKRTDANAPTTFIHNGVTILTVLANEASMYMFINEGTGYILQKTTQSDLPKSLTSVGYKRFDDGLIMQWHNGLSFTTSGAVTHTSSFAIPFPNVLLTVNIGMFNNGSGGESPVVLKSTGTSLSQLTVGCANAISTTTGYTYIALGY